MNIALAQVTDTAFKERAADNCVEAIKVMDPLALHNNHDAQMMPREKATSTN